MSKDKGLVSGLDRNSEGPCESCALLRRPAHQGTLTRYPSLPSVAGPLPSKERSSYQERFT